jgi:RNA-directed DNA polymerase
VETQSTGKYERMGESVTVPAMAKQTETTPTQWVWVDRAIWTQRMLAALGNGVKGDKWFSLIDKVYRPSTAASGLATSQSEQGRGRHRPAKHRRICSQ